MKFCSKNDWWNLWYFSFLKNFKKGSKLFVDPFRSKILFNKKLSDFVETFPNFYQILYPKNVNVLTKLDIFLLNEIFIRILTLFFLNHTLYFWKAWECQITQKTYWKCYFCLAHFSQKCSKKSYINFILIFSINYKFMNESFNLFY